MSTNYESATPLTLAEFVDAAEREGWVLETDDEERQCLVSTYSGQRGWVSEWRDHNGDPRVTLTRYGANHVERLLDIRPFVREQTPAWSALFGDEDE